jgi:prepilin-type N-terminal cleavage/methylation domain-containing protein
MCSEQPRTAAFARMRRQTRRHARSRTVRSRGFTLLETLAVLAIAALLLAGLASLMSTSYGNARAQQTALYQAQLASGAMQFVKSNYATLVPALSAAQPLVVSLSGANVTGNKLSTYLPTALQAVNAYQQTPCLLIFRGSGTGWSGATGGLQDIQAYLVTEGGQTIDDRTLGHIEANGGAGAGAIQAMGNGMVQGAFGSWSVKLAALNPTNASCSGTPTASGHLASEVYYSGDAGAAGDFLYRQPESVTGVTDGNTMHAPIVLADDNHVDRTADADCGSGASPNDGQGRVTSDSTGNLLYCDGTEWSVEGSMHWRAPVGQYADLSSPGYVPQAGDVALVQADGAAQDQPQGSGEGRAFVYNGAAWEPLGIDQNGNLSVPGLLSLGHQTVGASCSNPASEAQVATDAQGRVLSCQNGAWEPQENLQLVSTRTGCAIQMATAGATDYSECSGPTGWSAYSSQTGTYSYTQNLYVTLSEPGMISATSWSHINDDWCGTTASNEAQMSQDLDIYDASNDDLAHSEAATPRLTNDMAGLNNTLSQAVAQPGTYRIQIVTNWATYAGNTTPWTSSYCGPGGNTIFNTPLVTGWSINTYY